MNGDSENEFGSGEDQPAPSDLPANQNAPAGEGENTFRPFRSWASAYEPQPSMWSRMRSRVAGLFSRKAEARGADTDGEDVDIEPDAGDSGADTSAPAELPASPSAVAPPDDFKFPWTRPEGEPGLEQVPEPIPAEPAPASFDAHDEPLAAASPEVARPGFLARLFGRKSKELASETPQEVEAERAAEIVKEPAVAEALELGEPVMEVEAIEAEEIEAQIEVPAMQADAPSVDLPTFESARDDRAIPESFESVDEALPAAEDSPAAGEETGATGDAKPGLFSRLFRRSQETKRPSLEIEVHEDRIEAAAQALDDVGEEQFESFEGKSSAVEQTFESVDEALPAPSLDGLPLIESFGPPDSPVMDRPAIESFAPTEAPIAGPPIAEPPVVEYPAIERLVVEEPERDRRTAEVPVADGPIHPEPDRPTAEVPVLDLPLIEELSTEEVAPPSFDGESTLEIEEKTDEFELVTADEEKIDTLEVERKSFWTDSFVAKLFRRGDTQVEKVGAKETEAAEEKQAVFLLAKFRAFYNEIIRFQHQKSEFTAGFATAIVTEYTADLSPDAAAEALSKKLSELLELQAAEAKWMGGEAAQRYPDAQYAMAALADETFTYTEWEGQGGWAKVSLERKIFQTNASDIELFRRIDKLLKESPDSVVARDLARVYLLVLAAGFQGKWRPFGLARPIAEYRRRLYEYIHNDDALMLYGPDRRVFPDAVSRTLEGHAVSRFSAAQRWAAILFFLVVSYTVIAHIAWNRVSADLKDVTARIKSGNTAGAR